MTKKNLTLGLAAIGALTLSACATAPAQKPTQETVMAAPAIQAATPVTQTAEASKGDPEEVICKRQKIVGSNFKRKVCGTRAHWDALQQKVQDDINQYGGNRRNKGFEGN